MTNKSVDADAVHTMYRPIQMWRKREEKENKFKKRMSDIEPF